MNRKLYALHRWVSAVALAQLTIWVCSGLFFALFPIAQVRGSFREGAHVAPLSPSESLVAPAVVLGKLGGRGPVEKLELTGTPEGPFYRGKLGGDRFRIDARTGERRDVGEAEARLIASRDQHGGAPALSVTRIVESAPTEYRGKPLPAWRVALSDGASTVIYVDAVTGEVTARRNDLWRVYDFLWSLHIMDYRERESFNHPLLVVAASLGLLTVATGGVLWVLRFKRWRRRNGAADAGQR